MEYKDHPNHFNVHVLNAILEAARGRAVLASRDIYDDNGMKLLAQGKPMTPALQERLLEHRLKLPLETSLRFESGLDKMQLRQAFVDLLKERCSAN